MVVRKREKLFLSSLIEIGGIWKFRVDEEMVVARLRREAEPDAIYREREEKKIQSFDKGSSSDTIW